MIKQIQSLEHVDTAGGNIVGSLTSLVWGLAMLKADPPMELSRAILIETQVQIPNMGEQACANIAWGLCKMNIRPPPSWIQDYEKQCRRKMISFKRGIVFSNIIWSLSHWRAEPGESWLREFVRRSTPTITSLNEDGIAALLQGLADLEHKPPNVGSLDPLIYFLCVSLLTILCLLQSWVSMCLEVFHKQGGGKPDTLVAVLWSISRLLQQKKISMVQDSNFIPGSLEKESEGMLMASHAAMERADPVEGSSERAAVSVVAMGPGKQWVRFYLPILKDLADGVVVGMHQLDAPRLVDVLVALADLGVHPGAVFIKTHQRQCDENISSFTAYQMRLMSNAMSRLERFAPAVRQKQMVRMAREEALPMRDNYI